MDELRISTGICEKCGQHIILPVTAGSREEANRIATENCDCLAGAADRQIRCAYEVADQIFGMKAAENGFATVRQPDITMILAAINAVGKGTYANIRLTADSYTAVISRTSKGKIRIVRTEGRGCALEA